MEDPGRNDLAPPTDPPPLPLPSPAPLPSTRAQPWQPSQSEGEGCDNGKSRGTNHTGVYEYHTYSWHRTFVRFASRIVDWTRKRSTTRGPGRSWTFQLGRRSTTEAPGGQRTCTEIGCDFALNTGRRSDEATAWACLPSAPCGGGGVCVCVCVRAAQANDKKRSTELNG